MHRSIFADECEHFAHLFTVTICTTFSSVSLCVFSFFLVVVVALRSLFANRILFLHLFSPFFGFYTVNVLCIIRSLSSLVATLF